MPEATPAPPFILLTQDDCPRCERLKAMLERPLRGKYERDIAVVHRQSEPDRFRALADAYGVRSAPVIIHAESQRVLFDVESLGAVNAFLGQGERVAR